jgi:hypothetical protein
MDKWYPHTRSTNTLNNLSALYISFIHNIAHFMPHGGIVPCHLPQTK